MGPESLSAQELLACVLGTGMSGQTVYRIAEHVLAAGGSLAALQQWSVHQYCAVPGIGRAKAVQLAAVAELSRRMMAEPLPEQQSIRSEIDAMRLLRPYFLGKQKEHFVALLLDTRNRLIRMSTISIGSLNATIVHPRELFREAIQSAADAVIIAHNHPSGDPEPSKFDLDLTNRLIGSGKLIGIKVLDHIIIGRRRDISLKAEGYFENPGAEMEERTS